MKKKKPPEVSRFNRIVSEAARLKLPGHWHASSHGFHPRGVIRRPYILTDRWNTNGYCSAHVLTVPDSELKQTCDWPTYSHSKTFPEPLEGDAIAIYDTGRWLEEGPWQEQLPQLLDALEAEVKKAQESEKATKDAEESRRKAAHEEKVAAAKKAVAAWSP